MFASSKREICAFPAKSEHVALYLQHLLDTTHSHSADPDISLFSTHSFRAGGASAAANAGVPDRGFQRQEHSKSVSAKNGYVDHSLSSCLSVLKKLGF